MFGDVESVMYAVNSIVPQRSVLGPLEFVAYTVDVVEIMHQYQLRHHIYTDDMQLYAHSTITDVHGLLLQLQHCITDVHEWCTSRRLQLNDAKTELVWFGSRSNLTKLASSDCSLLVDGNNIKPCTIVRDLGVWQWTVAETTRQQSSQQLLLPHPPSVTSQSLCWTGCYETTGIYFHPFWPL